jgi:WD40 repeat protein
VSIDLWDLPSGKPLAPINFQSNTTPTSMTFSTDGKTLYAACPGSGVHAWDVASRVASGNTQPGEYVLGAGRFRATIERENKVGDFFLRLMRRGSVEEYYRHRLPPVGNSFLSVSRDESRLAFLTDGENLHVLDLKSRNLVVKFNVAVERQSYAAHISPDGKSVTRLPSVLAFSPGGRWAFSGDDRGEVRAWEVATGELVATLEGPKQKVMGLVMASSGRLAAVALDGVFMWDLKGTAPATSPEVSPVVGDVAMARRLDGNGGNASSIAFSPDGRLLVTGHDNPQPAIRLWDVATGKEQRAVTGLRGPARSIAFSLDGKKIISGEGDTVFARDGQLGSRGADRLGFGQYVSPDGRHRAVIGYNNRTRGVLLRVWSQGATGEKAFPVDDNSNVFLSFSADESRVAFIGRKGTLYVFELASKKTIFKQNMGGGGLRPYGAFISPDGHFVLVSYDDGAMRLWDIKERKAVHTFRGHKGGVRNAVFSADGKRIYSGDSEGFVHVWDVATEKLLGTLKGASRGLGQLALSANGRRLAAVAGEGIYLWDLSGKAGGNGTGGGR